MNYTFTGARHGMGTTTIALILASQRQGTFCSTDPHAWSVGDIRRNEQEHTCDGFPVVRRFYDGFPVVRRFGDGPTIVDVHTPEGVAYPDGYRHITVVRNDYVSARAYALDTNAPKEFVLVLDKSRALDQVDIERASGARCVGVVELDPSIARAYDAGLLVQRGFTILGEML